MRVIRLVLSLSLVMAFMASASESAAKNTSFESESSTLSDTSKRQPSTILNTHSSFTELVLLAGIDSDPDCSTSLALKRPVIKFHVTAFAANTRISQLSTAQWHLIRGPPLV